MIPTNNALLTTEIQVEQYPTRTYRLDTDKMVLCGFCDGLEAMGQAAELALNTERFEHAGYSWVYGIETLDLYGKPVDYVCIEIERRIREALLVDERVLAVDSFVFDTGQPKVVRVYFTIHTIYGDLAEEKVVQY